jgi:hypothetical protein
MDKVNSSILAARYLWASMIVTGTHVGDQPAEVWDCDIAEACRYFASNISVG